GAKNVIIKNMYPPSENYVSNVELNHFSFDWSFQETELPPGVSQSDYAPPLPNAPPPCLPISTSFHHGQQSFCQQPKQQKTSRGKYNKHKRGSLKNWTGSRRPNNVYSHDESSAGGQLNVNYLASQMTSSVNSVPLPWHTSNAPERTPPWRSHISTSLDGTDNGMPHEEFGSRQEYFRLPFTPESSSINHNQFSRHYMSQYGYQSTHRITASQYDLQRSFNTSSSQIVIEKPAAPNASNTKNSQERIVKVDDTKKKIVNKPVNSDKKQPVLVFPRSKKPKTEETKKHNQNNVICQVNANDEPLNPRTGVNAGLQLFKKKTNSKKIEFKLVSSIGLSKLNIDKCRIRESRVQDDHLEVSAKKIKLDTNKNTEATQAVQSTKSQVDKEDNVCSNTVEPLKPTIDETRDDVKKINYGDSISHNENSFCHDSEFECKKMNIDSNIDSDIVIEPCQIAHKNIPITGNEKENEDANAASELPQSDDLNIMAVDTQLGHTELIVDESDGSIKPLLSKQKRVEKKLLNVTSKEGKERDSPKPQPRSRQSYVRKQKISWMNTKDAKVNKCESCGDKSKDLETIGALELCSTCVPLFTSQVARAKAFPHNFKLNQKVEVLNIDKVWYPAKIVILETDEDLFWPLA
ncbi:2699_t:CDS:2, partial [Dentiscutata heterogama]